MSVIECDVCIVGCGAAGAILGSRLATIEGRRVVVLERGPRITDAGRDAVMRRVRDQLQRLSWDAGSAENMSFEVASDGEPPWSQEATSAVGGTSLQWTGNAARPRAEDLVAASSFGVGADWPFGYDELEPWLGAAERALGVAADTDNPYASPRSTAFPMPAHERSWFDRRVFAPACEQLGWVAHSHPVAIRSETSADGPACSACRYCRVCPSGARYSADRRHVRHFVNSPTVQLLERVQVRRLEARDGRVIAAHAVAMRSDEDLEVRAESFVLAAGAVETPRLLLRSELGGEAVGRGFTDQALVRFECVLPDGTGTALGFPTIGCDFLRQHEERDRLNTASIVMHPSYGRPETALDSVFRSGRFSPERMRRAALRSAHGVLRFELSARGQLTLDSDLTDEHGDPIARVEFALDARDRRSIGEVRAPVERLARAMGATEFAYIWPTGFLWGASPMGGARMAASADEGVCDADLKVFGTENLHVLSSAAIPHLGAAQTPLTLAALALRLAAHLGVES